MRSIAISICSSVNTRQIDKRFENFFNDCKNIASSGWYVCFSSSLVPTSDPGHSMVTFQLDSFPDLFYSLNLCPIHFSMWPLANWMLMSSWNVCMWLMWRVDFRLRDMSCVSNWMPFLHCRLEYLSFSSISLDYANESTESKRLAYK